MVNATTYIYYFSTLRFPEPSKLINNLKTVSSRYLRKEFVTEVEKVYWKDVFWTNGYFIVSCGGVTVEQLKKYIEGQNRPVQ
jgi:putative transposase